MANLIESLQKSDNKLVAAAVKSAAKWSKLKHTKADLELLLTFNIAEVRFKPKGESSYVNLIVTGNNRFIEVYKAAKKKDKEKKMHSSFTGIKTKEIKSVMAYDLIAGKLKTIDLTSWQVVNMVTLSEDNILVLDQIIKDCLGR